MVFYKIFYCQITYVNTSMECKLLENQVYIAVDGQYRFCCVSQELSNVETVKTHTPIEWLTSPKVAEAKVMLANGTWPSACNRCMQEEALGLPSRRTTKTDLGPGITHLDIRLGNSCNLKCISCNPQSSSSIAYENLEMLKHGIIPVHSVTAPAVNWFDEQYLSYITQLPLKEVYFTGGEPMMVKHLPKILEVLDPSVTLRFNTNATIYNEQLTKLLKKFNRVIMGLSIDAVGKRIEYIRYGSVWTQVEENSKKYAEFCDVFVTPCISILNGAYYYELEEWCADEKFKLIDNLLMDPAWLHVKNAPDNLKEKFKHIGDWKNQPADTSQHHTFIKNITKLDSFRNVRIQDYLPEVAQAYGIS